MVSARASADLGRDCRFVEIDGGVDVELEKTARPTSVLVGERVEYTIVVRNIGPNRAYSPTVVDRLLDERVQLLSAASANGRCQLRGRGTPNRRVLCFLRDLGPGDSATIMIAARALEPGVAQNRATAVGTVPPDVGRNNTDTAAVAIREEQARPGGDGQRPRPRPKPPFTG